uniref:Uncharacterized protein n=1 Tax=Romanomermis culicivorax TaxID=13658 RepID=A0A915IAS4_ROMCU
MLHKKRITEQAAIKGLQGERAIPFQQKKENLLEANKINKLMGAYHQMNQFGLDCWKKKYHQKQCLYYELLENGAKPRKARSVEIVVKEESSILDEIDQLTREAWSRENDNSSSNKL